MRNGVLIVTASIIPVFEHRHLAPSHVTAREDGGGAHLWRMTFSTPALSPGLGLPKKDCCPERPDSSLSSSHWPAPDRSVGTSVPPNRGLGAQLCRCECVLHTAARRLLKCNRMAQCLYG